MGKPVHPILFGAFVVAVVGGLSVLGFRLLQGADLHQRQVKEPAKLVAKYRAELEAVGVKSADAPFDYVGQELVPDLKGGAWDQGYDGARSSLGVKELIASPKAQAMLVSISQEDNLAWPTPQSFLMPTHSGSTKRAAGAVRTFITESVGVGNLVDAIKGMEFLFDLTQAMTSTHSESAVVMWYGVQVDLIRATDEVLRHPGLNETHVEALRQLWNREVVYPKLADIVRHTARASIAATQHIRTLNEEEMSVLCAMLEPYEEPDLRDPESEKAMESRVSALWLEVIAQADRGGEPESLGIELDRQIETAQSATKTEPTGFMIRAIPLRYEVLGRLVKRVMQAQALLIEGLGGTLNEGVMEADVQGVSVKMEIEREGDYLVAISRGVASRGKPLTDDSVQIDQLEGVRMKFPVVLAR
jgi:hypothetical protein